MMVLILQLPLLLAQDEKQTQHAWTYPFPTHPLPALPPAPTPQLPEAGSII